MYLPKRFFASKCQEYHAPDGTPMTQLATHVIKDIKSYGDMKHHITICFYLYGYIKNWWQRLVNINEWYMHEVLSSQDIVLYFCI